MLRWFGGGLAILALCGCSSSSSDASPTRDAGSDAPACSFPAAGDEADAGVAEPTAADIQFSAVAALPSGEQILFNDWISAPNAVYSMHPDGTAATKIFEAYRVWSMGVSQYGNHIAFACGDPMQEQHYGLTLGDAIQNTFVYDAATQSASALSWGNINDECHTFSASGDAVYVCRRYDFQSDGSSKGYRLGRIDTGSGAFAFLTPDVTNQFHLHPEPTPDGALLYTRIDVTPPSTQHRSIRRLSPCGDDTLVLDNASGDAVSPDGTRFAYQDYGDNRKIYVANLDGSGAVKIADREGTNLAFSPDGTRLAYLYNDAGANCSHIDVVHTDGSDAQSPTRVRDCGQTGEMITELSWITR